MDFLRTLGLRLWDLLEPSTHTGSAGQAKDPLDLAAGAQDRYFAAVVAQTAGELMPYFSILAAYSTGYR
jgi:hypothetical protein